ILSTMSTFSLTGFVGLAWQSLPDPLRVTRTSAAVYTLASQRPGSLTGVSARSVYKQWFSLGRKRRSLLPPLTGGNYLYTCSGCIWRREKAAYICWMRRRRSVTCLAVDSVTSESVLARGDRLCERVPSVCVMLIRLFPYF
ncbi:hypothetical protein BDV98DRAFT_569953, partial [Pterulicium gracile]